ncbi:MAG: DMT family transporter [Gemmatimonadetes bacterium]|nr:DMT family transporter [Gemmatimonadota bacterium]
MSQLRLLPFAVWLGTGLVWGTTWVVIRLGLEEMAPLTFAALRTILAAVVLLAIALLLDRRRRPPPAELRFWALVGIPQMGFPYALIFWAEQWVSAGLTAMLFATFPAFTAVTAHFMLRDEPLTVGKISGSLLALVAVALLVSPSQGTAMPLVAPAAILLASISASFGAVMVRGHGRATSTAWLTAIQVTSAAVFLAGLALIFERGEAFHLTTTAVLAIVYLALAVTVVCYLGLFWLLKHLEATFVSMGVIFETTVGVFLGALVLAEPLGVRVFAGLALVAVSVYLVTVKRHANAVVV